MIKSILVVLTGISMLQVCQAQGTTEITNEIHYTVDIEYGRKTNRPKLSDHEREQLLNLLIAGVKEEKLIATQPDPLDGKACRDCTLTPQEFKRALHPQADVRLEDPETGEEKTVQVMDAYDLDEFHMMEFIEEWDMEGGSFSKNVKAIGLLKPMYDDSNRLMGHVTVCHVWFE